MAIEVKINNVAIQYPQVGDTEWGVNATNFAIQTENAFTAIGLSDGTTVDLPGTLDVTGNTTLDANLSVGGNASVTGNLTVDGNTQLGNANTDTIGVTGIVNIDSGVLYVDPVNNRVGINDTTPSQALDVTGNVAISGNSTIGGTLGVTSDVAINTNKFNITASSGNTTIAGTLGVTGIGTFTSDLISGGILTASNSTNITTAPPITFTGDTNTGIGHSSADTLDYVTNGVSRARLNSTGQQSSVVPDLSGSNTTLYNEYKCRAWVNFNGTTASPSTIRGSGNVSSITKSGTGDYTINFTTAMPDANYSMVSQALQVGATGSFGAGTPTSSSVRLVTFDTTFALIDCLYVWVAIFR